MLLSSCSLGPGYSLNLETSSYWVLELEPQPGLSPSCPTATRPVFLIAQQGGDLLKHRQWLPISHSMCPSSLALHISPTLWTLPSLTSSFLQGPFQPRYLHSPTWADRMVPSSPCQNSGIITR